MTYTEPSEQPVPTSHGEVRVRLYPAQSPTGVALVWAHGGGFAYGDLDMPEADWVARSLAERGIAVASVDYALSPEIDRFDPQPTSDKSAIRFPVASEQLSDVFEWFATHPDVLGASSLSLGGASAGGNLATGAALRLVDQGRPAPATLLLAYPVEHAVLPEPSSHLAALAVDLPPEARFLPDQVRVMNLNYVGDEALLGERYAFPAGHDVAGLPPTFILNSDADDLRSSSEAFAADLTRAAVDVLVVREPGTIHGHLNTPEHPGAVRSIERMAAWLRAEALLGL
ncbi:alpha/beta hydrolase [Herbiconiux sp. SYSU D00978]|uniref:alpha/beta hydrolase n=1 Tax=Herbiconiux sp. SYSU D00978 TaxID=2812562 RepID=UPI001A979FCC|nr:alpha/beta hydrolase fold domain-containing protein [Herbiconiux sp. SYSU D00978]